MPGAGKGSFFHFPKGSSAPAVHADRKLCLPEAEGEEGEIFIIPGDRLGAVGAKGGKRGKDPFDLLFFLQLQLPQTVVRLHHRHRLDEKVAPDAEVSCTSPRISFLYSTFTGITYRPSRMVTMFSCKYLE